MLENIIQFLQSCPWLENRTILAEHLGEAEGDVSVQAVTCEPIVYRYADGDSLRQFVFKISSREEKVLFGGALPEAFYEGLAAWLQGNLPDLGSEQTAQYFELTQTPAVAERDYGSLRYEMECRLIYYQKGA